MINSYELAVIFITLLFVFSIVLLLTFNYGFILGKKYMLSYLSKTEDYDGMRSQRASLESLTCDAEAWLFTLSDWLHKAREEEAARHGDEE